MERELLILGMLRLNDMHGYQLTEFIDSHLGSGVHLTRSTAYHLLNRMTKDSWITYKESQEGNRPTRRVYSIVPKGEEAFQRLLRESLADYRPAEFPSEIGLLFLDAIPSEEAVPLLVERHSAIQGQLSAAQSHGHQSGSMLLMIEHQIRHLKTELEWLEEVISRVRSE